jgi:hypothetical protein
MSSEEKNHTGFKIFCYVWGFASLIGKARSLENQNAIIENQERKILMNAEILRTLKMVLQKMPK